MTNIEQFYSLLHFLDHPVGPCGGEHDDGDDGAVIVAEGDEAHLLETPPHIPGVACQSVDALEAVAVRDLFSSGQDLIKETLKF